MELIWKIVLSFLTVVVIAVSGVGITMGNLQVVEANQYFEELSGVITASNYSPQVIEECEQEAVENGYELTVTVRGKEDLGTAVYAEAVFEYKYEIPLFGISDTKVKYRIL